MPVTCETSLAADVLRALGDRPTPAVAVAAHILAAEILTAECEACPCATLPGDLCRACQARSRRAAIHRLAAADVQAACGLAMIA